MCTLTDKLDNTGGVIGYKVAAKKGDEYFSIAIGHKYDLGEVPVILDQERLSDFFSQNILDESVSCSPWSSDMVGRTAVFLNKASAIEFLEALMPYPLKRGYTPVLLKMTVKGSLLFGHYMAGDHVVAGREITYFQEEKIHG